MTTLHHRIPAGSSSNGVPFGIPLFLAVAMMALTPLSALPASAADPYFLVVDVPTDLGPTSYAPADVVRNDNGAFSSPWAFPLGVRPNALNFNSSSDVLFTVAEPTDIGGTLWEPRDVIRYNGVDYMTFFDGSLEGVPADAVIDSLLIDDGDLVIGFSSVISLGPQTFEPADLIRVTAGTFSLFLDASATLPPIPASTNVTAAAVSGDLTILSFDIPTSLGPFTYLPGELVAWDGSSFASHVLEAAWPPASRVHGLTFDGPACVDGDSDGYGSPASPSCSGGPELDCDDGNPDINPGVAEVGCDGIDNDCDAGTEDILDADMDMFACDLDCDDDNAEINPSAAEVGCDDIDNDCNVETLDILDADEDTFTCDVDCDDDEPLANPGGTEIGCDTIDNDCDPGTPDVLDADEDTFACDVDCDDAEPLANPGGTEIGCDGIDNDCSELTPDLLDGDRDTYTCDVDCNDGAAAINPGAEEVPCDTLDNDCDAGTPDVVDADSDTFDCTVDCDDGNADINPGAAEIGCDTLDNDCNAATPDVLDADADTYACDVDCDDDNVEVNPGAAELGCDGLDNDCDAETLDILDADSDTFTCDVDCDDDDAAVNPDATEVGCDGLDNDCDAGTPDILDADADTFACDVDCDDDNDAVNPGAAEVGCDGVDNDCNAGTPDVLDADADTFACDVDCDDDNAGINPAVSEVGCDGIDNDCNAGTPDLTDGDADGHMCDVDCDDLNGDAWAIPGEALQLLPTSGKLLYVWSPPTDGGAIEADLAYDVIRSSNATDFRLGSDCVVSDTGTPTEFTDADLPPTQTLFFYLVRVQNSCPDGVSSIGTASDGTPRSGRTCP